MGGLIYKDMPAPLSSQTERPNRSQDLNQRRSVRVLLSLPIMVSGKTTTGEDFSEETRTLVVNAHGALISLRTSVAAGQLIEVANKATQSKQECRIIYLGNAQGGNTQMGIEFIKPSALFWQIDFPPDDWVVPES
jgi:hypothetical protein